MSSFKCLLVFDNQAKCVEISEGTTNRSLLQLLRSTFQNQSISLIQQWRSDWNSWVEISEDHVANEGMQKYKGISCKSVGNLSPSTSVVFCCDMQERFKPAIKYFAEIAEVGNRVLKTSEKLGIPLVVTEQYPKGLGKTVEELDIGHAAVLEEKTKFSMMTPKIVEFLTSQVHLQSVVLFGVEAHVCVQQTAHDLITRGYDVHIIADATSSRTQADRHLAFERLRSLGAFVTTCETVLLQWVADKNHPKFKEIQQIIKISPPDTGLIMKSNI